MKAGLVASAPPGRGRARSQQSPQIRNYPNLLCPDFCCLEGSASECNPEAPVYRGSTRTGPLAYAFVYGALFRSRGVHANHELRRGKPGPRPASQCPARLLRIPWKNGTTWTARISRKTSATWWGGAVAPSLSNAIRHFEENIGHLVVEKGVHALSCGTDLHAGTTRTTQRMGRGSRVFRRFCEQAAGSDHPAPNL